MKISLNGDWKYKIDVQDIGIEKKWWEPVNIENNMKDLSSIKIPSCWNTIDKLEKYEGIVWFFKTLELGSYDSTKDLLIKFKAANYYTTVWVDGNKIGENEGGFLPFQFPIESKLLKSSSIHHMALRVENIRKKNRIPGISFDWYNWGGIYRDVDLFILDKLRFGWTGVHTKDISGETATVEVSYEIIDNRDISTIDVDLDSEINWNLYYIGNISTNGTKEEQDNNKEELNTKEDERVIAENKIDKHQNSESDIDNINGEAEVEDSDIIDDLFSESIAEDDTEQIENVPIDLGMDKIEGVLIKSGAISISKVHRKGQFLIKIEEPHTWSVNNPELYQLVLTIKGSHQQKMCRFGIRTITTKNTYLFLNDKRIRLYGVSLHEELMPYGRAIPEEERRQDIISIKALGFNAIRTGHYPHDESFYRIADEEGVLIFEEIPVYWNIDFSNQETLILAKNMLKRMIRRDFNRPSIIMWSCGNEIPIGGSLACVRFIGALTRYAKTLDNSRLISWVSLPSFTKIPRSVKNTTDLYNMNMYFGWYYLSPYNLNFFLDAIHYANRDIPIILSEFGAGAKCGFHVPVKKFKKFSEERQASVISHQIKVLNSKEYVAGFFIWIYRDFRSHRRTNKYQEGYNRKGIVSEKNEKKLIAKWMPKLVNKRFNIQEITHHKLKAKLFQVLGWPLFKLIHIITNVGQKLTNRFHGGDSYYMKTPREK
ncbi:MAG: hypothetical protein GF364_05445 [Candidatus Lokiarchaeota archaeon]|nr:hypothetical protein [Candidatus Lokiarchaeota archaeon]